MMKLSKINLFVLFMILLWGASLYAMDKEENRVHSLPKKQIYIKLCDGKQEENSGYFWTSDLEDVKTFANFVTFVRSKCNPPPWIYALSARNEFGGTYISLSEETWPNVRGAYMGMLAMDPGDEIRVIPMHHPPPNVLITDTTYHRVVDIWVLKTLRKYTDLLEFVRGTCNLRQEIRVLQVDNEGGDPIKLSQDTWPDVMDFFFGNLDRKEWNLKPRIEMIYETKEDSPSSLPFFNLKLF